MPHGFTATDVKTILKHLTGRDYSQWWANNVDAPADIDFDALFKKVGLMLERPKDAKAVASVDAMAKKILVSY
eukprot:GDKH01011809.1.p1 GENE.GDKH01011809.1~~GDKH01011809.1.p1  ORF type:complete len:83 (-),score=22.49 GDKH01011809.1:83-301(-)